MIVVPDAGPLIYLAGAGELRLLECLFDRVVVPEPVWHEVVVDGDGLTGAAEVAAASWLEVMAAEPEAALLATLDRGEASAIPLAEALGATLLCDDGEARRVARERGLKIVGSLGVLLQAKRSGHLEAIRPVIDMMRAQGMFASDRIVRSVLDAAGE